jgi:diguanylate cyclase (GGDEF)-like protein/PAS domain S-box-containing protein
VTDLLLGSDGVAAGSPSRPEDLPEGRFGIDGLRAAAAEAGAPLLALVTDTTGSTVIAWANEALRELLGLAADELVGRQLGSLSGQGAPGHADWTTVVAEAVLCGSCGWVATTVARVDGSRPSVQVRVTAAATAGWIVRLHPVTDGEQAVQEARLESEHRVRALAEHAPVGIVLSEVGVRLGFVNDRFAELAGLEAARLLGSGWLDVIHPEDLPALREALDAVLSGTSCEQTVRVLTVGDAPRWAQFRLAPVSTPRRAAGFIATVEDITARRAWEAQLAYQASHDALTGLSNRRRLVETLAHLLDSRRTRDHQFAVLFCDLDRFKAVNDTLGHHVGDLVLVEVGRRLTGIAREHDIVARIAGDEFVVVLHKIRDSREAEAAATRYLAALTAPLHLSGQDLQLSASIGVALPAPADTPESLLRAADRGMYQAKTAGPGNYRLATPPADPNETTDPGLAS